MTRTKSVLTLAFGIAAAGGALWLLRGAGRQGWIARHESGSPTTLAFEFGGHVGQAEVREMADAVLAAFDEHRQIDLLILLPSFTGITPAGALDLKGMKASVLALGKVRRYAVVAPPRWAGAMIELSDALIPVEARTFALRYLEAARAWVNAPSAAEAASAPA